MINAFGLGHTAGLFLGPRRVPEAEREKIDSALPWH